MNITKKWSAILWKKNQKEKVLTLMKKTEKTEEKEELNKIKVTE